MGEFGRIRSRPEDRGPRSRTSEMDGPRPGTVLVASPDRLFAEAAARLLSRQGWTVAGIAGDGLAAVAAVARSYPTAVLATDDLPRLGTTAFVKQVRRRWPLVTVVVLGSSSGVQTAALDAQADVPTVLAALARPAEGLVDDARMEPSSAVELAKLTPRERTVLRMLATGRSRKQIGLHLGISAETVRTHMQHLYATLGCHSRVEVIRYAVRHGLGPPQPGA